MIGAGFLLGGVVVMLLGYVVWNWPPKPWPQGYYPPHHTTDATYHCFVGDHKQCAELMQEYQDFECPCQCHKIRSNP